MPLAGGDEGDGDHPHLHPVKSPKGGPPEAAFNKAGPLPSQAQAGHARACPEATARERDFSEFLQDHQPHSL